LAVEGDAYHEGFYSLLDSDPRIVFDRFARGNALAAELQGNVNVERIRAFSKGFYKMHEADGRIFITDLRMGQEPSYIFRFAVAQREGTLKPLAKPEQMGGRPDLERALPWLWQRMWGDRVAPPR